MEKEGGWWRKRRGTCFWQACWWWRWTGRDGGDRGGERGESIDSGGD